MFLSQLYLRNFRNYGEVCTSFSPAINLIQGANAQGKTNLLEAIFLLSTGKSFRTARLTDLIHHGAEFFYLEAAFSRRGGVEERLKLYFDRKQRYVEYNNTRYPTFASLLGLLPCVLLAPEDIALIAGSPTERRRFLNLHIAQVDPLYVHHLIRFHRAVRQRNQLLKAKSRAAIDAWEQMMAESASYLVQQRKVALSGLAPSLLEHMRAFSDGKERLELDYLPSFYGDVEAFCGQFKRQREREMQIGSTLSGPQRDDLVIKIEGKEAKSFASEGQKRCCISAIRLAEWSHLSAQTETAPLLCIDDFGVHLDQERHALFQEKLKQCKQVFLTSPYAASIADQTLLISSGAISSLHMQCAGKESEQL